MDSSSDELVPSGKPAAITQKFEMLKQRRLNISQKAKEIEHKKLKKKQLKTEKRESANCSSSFHSESDVEKRWDEISKYLNVNKHLVTRTYERDLPQNKHEQLIDMAIKDGEIDVAEHVSDDLANKETLKMVENAVKAEEYVKNEKIKEDKRKSRKRKKLQWTFQTKQRWETKANMGYM